MRNQGIKRIKLAAVMCVALMGVILEVAGCGGGGGAAGGAGSSGNGTVRAVLKFPARAAGREAGSASGTVGIDIVVTGRYSVDNTQFTTKTAHLDVSSSGGSGGADINAPIGKNHLLTAVAAYPDGATCAIKTIIPEVAAGVVTTATADSRSTVIADAAIELAGKSGKELADLGDADVAKVAAAVDAIYSGGTPYAAISISDVLNYESVSGNVASVAVYPLSAVVGASGTQQFSADVKNSYGVTISGASATWSVSGGVGTISAAGLFTGTAAGSGVVTVTAGGFSSTASVTVTQGVPVSMSVTPPGAQSVTAGQSVTFAASALDSLGNTASVTPAWSVTGGIGTITSGGVFTGTTAGSGTVVATAGSLSASVNVTVTAGAAVTMSVSPAAATITQASTQQFTVSGVDAYGNTASIVPMWSVSGGVGTISSGGLFTPSGLGSGVVSAMAGGISATASVTVIAGSVSSVVVSPASVSMVTGATQQFTAVVKDASNNVLAVTASWSSSGVCGSIDGAGLFSATTPGSCSVTASAGGVTSGAVTVAVSQANRAPVANAGVDASGYRGVAISLDGTTSSDLDGDALTYSWMQTGGAAVTLTGALTGTPTFTAAATGAYTFELVVSDGVLASATDSVVVTITDRAPAANAGTDQNVIAGNVVTLGGSGTDPDGDPLFFGWAQTGGAAVTLTGANSATATFTAVATGAYVFELTTSDGELLSVPDPLTINVTLGPGPTVASVSPNNGANTGTVAVTITGTNFMSGASVTVGGTPLQSVVVVNSTTITGVVQAGMILGAHDVVVTNPDLQTASVLGGYFSVNSVGTNHSGAVTTTQTWTVAASPHIVTSTVTVANTCGGPVLTIEAGAVVKFAAGAALDIGTTNCGAIVANGTAAAPILFTSNAGSPAAGDWKGITFGANAQGLSALNYAVVEYAGNTTGSGLSFSASNIAVTNSTIRNNSGIGVKFISPYYPGAFTGNTVTGNTSYPMWIYAEYVRYLGAGNTYTGNGIDRIAVQPSSILSTGTWLNPGVPYEMQGSVTVANTCGGPTLTIAAGNTLKFAAGAAFDIGTTNCGSLVADGTAGQITFTSVAPAPAAGDWKGITFGVNTQATAAMRNVVVEYAGNTTGANVTMGSNNAELSNSIVRNGSGIGVLFTSGGGGKSLFTGNTITANAQWPIDVYANYMTTIGSGNTLTGNGMDMINVQAGVAGITGTWANNGVPVKTQGAITFNTNVTMAANLMVEAGGTMAIENTCGGPTLTVSSGVTMKFAAGTALNTGVGNCGKLIVNGVNGSPVTFTSAAGSPAPGDWNGLVFGVNTQSGTLLNYAIVEYAGAGVNAAGAVFNSVNVQVTNSTVRNTAGTGFRFNDGYYPAAFTGNTSQGNTLYPISIFGEFVRTLPAGNSYTGNATDAVSVAGDVVTTSGTWVNPGVPYLIQGSIAVENTCGGPTLTIAASSTLKFAAGTALTAGVGNCGAIVADGTLGQIKFTSAAAVPAAGDWQGISLGVNTQTNGVFKNVVVEYGGYLTQAGMTVGTNAVEISGSTIRNSAGVGVHFKDTNGGGENLFTGNTITGNTAQPLTVGANFLSTIPGGNTLTGNGDDRIIVQGAATTIGGTWANNGVPMSATGPITVTSSVTASADLNIEFLGTIAVANTCGGPTFTVGSGSVYKFGAGVAVQIGVSNCGKLVVNGTVSSPVTFTSSAAVPAAGDWGGISFGPNTQAGTLLNYTVVEYAGGSGAGLYFSNSNVQVTYSTVRYNAGIGLMYCTTCYPASFLGNLISSNLTYPMEIYAEYVRTLPDGNTFTGNGVNKIKVLGTSVLSTGTWNNHGVPYEVQSQVEVANTCGGPALTIAGGTTVQFAAGAGLKAGVTNCGKIVANGTVGGLITFTSAAASPAAGDWMGISFGGNTQAGTLLDNVLVNYGGANTFGNIYMNNTGTNVVVRNCASDNSSTYGGYTAGNATWTAPDKASCTFTGNVAGATFP